MRAASLNKHKRRRPSPLGTLTSEFHADRCKQIKLVPNEGYFDLRAYR
jgi:hypothetical protein